MKIMSKTHRYTTRVYYAETDAGGVVYHASYLHFLERARTEMMREAGFNHAQITYETGGAFVMVEANLKYRAPARLDDELIIETKITHLGGASLKLQQNVLKRVADHESLLLEGDIAMVYVSLADIKPLRIPQELRDALEPYLQTKEE
jgi:acyl-CoA thioester hydrolase